LADISSSNNRFNNSCISKLWTGGMKQFDKLRNRLIQQGNSALNRLFRHPSPPWRQDLETALRSLALRQPNEWDEDRTDQIEDMNRRLSKLNSRQMELVTMRFFKGYTYKQIGKALDISPQWVHKEMEEMMLVLRSI
jgi:RNA polymerase sigma factor (sigma-70 family)